ncbi:MAG: hypothetical protein WD342_16230 [Verrucomicrobiales bacterium]
MSSHLVAERDALWSAIRIGALVLRRAWMVDVFLESEMSPPISEIRECPSLQTWKLVEILSALAILTKAERVVNPNISNFVSKAGPIEFLKNGSSLYLWTQPRMIGDESGLGGQPDIVLTSSPEFPSHRNAVQIIEAKCRKSLKTSDIRSEFAKGFDLRVRSYFIWSFHSPSERMVVGAKKLGIELTGIGFDGSERSKLLIPQNLLHFAAETIENSCAAGTFARLLESSADSASKKHFELSPPPTPGSSAGKEPRA